MHGSVMSQIEPLTLNAISNIDAVSGLAKEDDLQYRIVAIELGLIDL